MTEKDYDKRDNDKKDNDKKCNRRPSVQSQEGESPSMFWRQVSSLSCS